MKKLSRALILMLAASLAATSCGGSAGTGNDTTQSSDTTEPVETEPSRENTPDTLPDDLDFGGVTVRVINRDQYDYLTFEMSSGEETGDIVNDALYNRDRRVEERLNVSIQYEVGAGGASQYMNDIRTVIQAGDDAYDYIVGVQWLILPQSREGLYYDLTDAPYLDFSQPWWNVNYMDTISVSSDTRYLLTGDISLNLLRNLSATFYNKTIYESLHGDPDGLYDVVLSGKWTHDAFRKLITEAYQDVNGDGMQDDGDVMGLVTTNVTAADHFSFASGLKLSERASDGLPKLVDDQSRNVAILEALDMLYFQTVGRRGYTDAEQNTLMTAKFVEGSALFIGDRLLRADSLRDMTDPYGVIPMPKLDEAQEEYIGLVHDSTPLYAIPLSLPDIDMACAVLEAMAAESYRRVTPAYYEVALKVKYAQDEQSGQIIDIIHAGMMTDFVYANNGSMGGTSLGTIARTLLGSSGGNYMSTYDSKKPAAEAAIADMIAAVKEE